MQIPFAGVNLIVVGYILVKVVIEMVSDLFRQEGIKKPPPFCSENTCSGRSIVVDLGMNNLTELLSSLVLRTQSHPKKLYCFLKPYVKCMRCTIKLQG